jgi:predicted GNAT superfamily acetyltransferase
VATVQAAGKDHPVSGSGIVIRKCESLDDMRACVALQKDVWNFADIDLVPLRVFVVAQKIGGQVVGAFDGKELVSFAMALPGARNGRPYLHSQMLAVRSDHRNAGLGRRMKLFQRDDALQRGFELMEWTFDPLEIKNAYLNIEKLGAIARRYTVNQYGITSSPLQGGLPTDRLIAEWWMNSRRVQSLLRDGMLAEVQPRTTISVPAQIYQWKASAESRSRALQIQERNREEFSKAFSRDLSVLRYERDPEGNGQFVLGRWDENLSYGYPERSSS